MKITLHAYDMEERYIQTYSVLMLGLGWWVQTRERNIAPLFRCHGKNIFHLLQTLSKERGMLSVKICQSPSWDWETQESNVCTNVTFFIGIRGALYWTLWVLLKTIYLPTETCKFVICCLEKHVGTPAFIRWCNILHRWLVSESRSSSWTFIASILLYVLSHRHCPLPDSTGAHHTNPGQPGTCATTHLVLSQL